MPSLPGHAVVDAILDAVQRSSASAVLVSPVRVQPRRFIVKDGEFSFLVWAYAWTLTPGGRPQLANEYRIQMTSVSSPLPTNADGYTVLIGYEPNLEMFAGFDVEKHRVFTAGSPSVQIDIRTLHQALQDGLAFSRKENEEIAVGVRPDQLIAYVRNANQLHRGGRDLTTYNLLNAASKLQPVAAPDLESLTTPRRRVVQEVARLARSASFRQQVLQAYDSRCAVTRFQLRLVDAAHILPVGAPGSSDHVRNGIALSPTYHRAFDQGLIYLDSKYEMQLNTEREALLKTINLHGGVRAFCAALGAIHLPPDRRQWPDVRLIERANRVRRIPV